MATPSLPPGTTVQEELQLLLHDTWDLQTSRYIYLVSYCAIAYDILITFGQERSLVWNAKWSTGKLLFFLVRYPRIVEGALYMVYLTRTSSDAKFCQAETIITSWGTLLFLVPLQIVIILRTIALWGRDKRITVLLVACFLAADTVILATITRITIDLRHYSAIPFVTPILGCLSGVPMLPHTITTPAWIAMILFDSLIFVLTFVKAIRSHFQTRTPLVAVLIRDGFLYYAVMLGAAIANLLFYRVLETSHEILASGLTPIVVTSFSIIGSRLMLNMRGAASGRGSSQGDSDDSAETYWKPSPYRIGKHAEETELSDLSESYWTESHDSERRDYSSPQYP